MSPVHYRCPHCKAAPGEPCKNYKAQACMPHGDRAKLARKGDDPTYQRHPQGGDVTTRHEQPSLFD